MVQLKKNKDDLGNFETPNTHTITDTPYFAFLETIQLFY